LNELSPRLQHLEKTKTEAERHVGVVASELETIEALWNEFARVANEANVHVLALKSEEKNIQQSIEHNQQTLASAETTIRQREHDVLAARNEIAEISSNVEQMQLDLFDVRKDLGAAAERKKIVDKEHLAKRTQAHEIELRLKDERTRQAGSLKAAHDLEIKIQELTMKSENLKSRAREKFEMELAAQEFADAATFDLTAAREIVRELSDKIRSLGAVNFAAFEEYKSEKERLDFMTAQRDDLLESEKTILQTIDEINTTAQNQFLGIFELIRENFIATFKSLFDEGDECDLKLEEGADPLEARIEIVAKPRGKRPTSIDLLSGGEKTLTAIALLFAIYLVKPSPFCILDEVDAPLDDTNIDRFTRIIRKFSDNTQFVIVTHNKRTMEAANAMYGVTMEEEGISKLVSVKFGEAMKN
jgi:chromosome segregation protein